MIPSSAAAMLKNLEQRTASNFLMENLLQSKGTPSPEFSLTLNWAASLMARQREKEATSNLGLNKKLGRDIDDVEEDNSVRIDVDLGTETEPETDGEDRVTPIRDNLRRIKIEEDRFHEDERTRDMEVDRDWIGFDHLNDSNRMTTRTDDRIGAEENCNNDDQCSRPSPVHPFTSSSTESRGIQAKERLELKFGVKAILADNYMPRRNTDNLQALQQASGLPTASTPGFSHSLQSSPPIQAAYAAGIAKPIARPTAYHPHHPPHPSHPSGPTQHHFTAHAHHTLQLLACRGPYLTTNNPASGHLSGTTTVVGGSFASGMQPGIGDLAGMSAMCFPWATSARGRPRKGMMRRAVFSDTQRQGLEKRFQLQKYISKPDRKKLAERLGLKDSQVKIWFQNRRMKWRNNKERELMASGGSREQTLPNKNNPNPDLSDTNNDRTRIDLNNASPLSSPRRAEEFTDNEENEEINVT
ncbi:homeobox protein Hox-A1a [Chelonus insularis]|uniref:homeobox protein Hox-A1a n=1 Tax=Chelonus insularis TaxID=460826 RepID=UPI00158E1B3F|nr:homeobox protein Hox-A1a [Chelonus insularis]